MPPASSEERAQKWEEVDLDDLLPDPEDHLPKGVGMGFKQWPTQPVDTPKAKGAASTNGVNLHVTPAAGAAAAGSEGEVITPKSPKKSVEFAESVEFAGPQKAGEGWRPGLPLLSEAVEAAELIEAEQLEQGGASVLDDVQTAM